APRRSPLLPAGAALRRLRSSLPLHSERNPRERKSPVGLHGAFSSVAHRYLTLTPFSAKYFTAPGCHGIGEASDFWPSIVMFSASLCARISSSRLSKNVLTML